MKANGILLMNKKRDVKISFSSLFFSIVQVTYKHFLLHKWHTNTFSVKISETEQEHEDGSGSSSSIPFPKGSHCHQFVMWSLRAFSINSHTHIQTLENVLFVFLCNGVHTTYSFFFNCFFTLQDILVTFIYRCTINILFLMATIS